MKYHVLTIEQINGESEGTYSEYSKSEKKDTFNAALSAFYEKLKNVSADIGTQHTFMSIKILNSKGEIEKSDAVGKYVEQAAE